MNAARYYRTWHLPLAAEARSASTSAGAHARLARRREAGTVTTLAAPHDTLRAAFPSNLSNL